MFNFLKTKPVDQNIIRSTYDTVSKTDRTITIPLAVTATTLTALALTNMYRNTPTSRETTKEVFKMAQEGTAATAALGVLALCLPQTMHSEDFPVKELVMFLSLTSFIYSACRVSYNATYYTILPKEPPV